MKNNSIIKDDVKKYKSRMLLIIFFGLISVISGAALMYVSGFLISKSSLKVGNILLLQVPVVLTRTFSLSQSTFSYVQRLTSHDLVLRIIEKMRTKVYRILEPQALKLKKEYKSGDLLGLISEDIEHLQNIYLKSIFPSITALVMYSLFVIFMFGYDFSYAILTFVFGIFILFVIPFISLIVTRKNFHIMKNSKYELYQEFTSAIFGITDLISSNKIDTFMDNYKEKENNLLKKEFMTKIFVHLREIIINILAGFVVFFMIYCCKTMTINHTIDNVYIASFCMMSLSVVTVAIMVSEAISQVPGYEVSIKRVNDFYNQDIEKEQELKEFTSSENNAIEIKNLYFGYEEKKEILKNINLSIRYGEKVAILGRSGVGKSTFIKLLTGTYKPNKGTISILGKVPNESLLGEKISLLNQKPYLFDMTIKENLELSTLKNDEEKELNNNINESLKKAQIFNLIDSLPNKINTNVFETGSRFSGGERQRISFARTLMQNNELLLLDEPTVGLDPKTEYDLLQTIFEQSKDKTVVWITHHLNSIESMDRIIFIKDGFIEMDGSHDYLYQNNKKYKELYDMDNALK